VPQFNQTENNMKLSGEKIRINLPYSIGDQQKFARKKIIPHNDLTETKVAVIKPF